jgi:hypothetical protein
VIDMAGGTIVYATRSKGRVTAGVRVDEGGSVGPVEYTATVPATDAQGNPLPAAEIKAALVAAWSAQRAGAQTSSVDVSSQINGNVNL